MLDLTLSEILKISKSTFKIDKKYHNKKILNFSIHIDNLSTDHLYFHWKTGSDNLHFIDRALKKGAFVITSEDKYRNIDLEGGRVIYVSSVKKILLELASYKRSFFEGEVVAITGSVGKSSIKNMLSMILSMNAHVIHTLGNENAWLGIYCALCNIKKNTKYVVLETGASGIGTLSIPMKVVCPTISILLDVNFSHQEKYPTVNDLIIEKASIIETLRPNGKLIISSNTLKMIRNIKYTIRADVQIIAVGNGTDIDILSCNLGKRESTVDVSFYGELLKLKIPQGNRADLINAVYVFTALSNLGIDCSKFNSLSRFYKPLPRRFDRNRIGYKENITFELIDDAYNSSPISIQSLLESIEIREVKEKILVLGDMLELGVDSEKLHQKVLENHLLNQFSRIVLIGEVFHKCQKTDTMQSFVSIDQFITCINDYISDGCLLVLKASHGINLYKLRIFFEKEAISVQKNIDWFIENETKNLYY